MSMPSFEESSRVRSKSRPKQKIFDLPLARQTLPLVRRIAVDAVKNHALHAHLSREVQLLRQSGRAPETLRRIFTATEEMDRIERSFRESLTELAALGAVLLDPVRGQIGFATLVNGSLAYLVYRTEENDIAFWRYRNQPKLRPIPECWNHEAFFPAEAAGLML